MPYPSFPTVTPQVTQFELAGDVDALGGTQLTMLLEGFIQQSPPSLEDLFPTNYIPSRIISMEQYIDSVGIAPLVTMGVPSNIQLGSTRRVRKKFATPAFTREDFYIEDSAVNDLRKAGTFNDRVNPAEKIAQMVEQAYMRRNELITFLRYQALLGGIKYTDARTGTAIDVNTNIPRHNFFRYDGWDATVAAGDPIPTTTDGNAYSAFKAMTAAKGRKEALFFTDVQYRVGVPWTNKQADIAGSVRRLKHWLSQANRNDGWELYMAPSLYAAIQENELIRSQAGMSGILGNFDLTGGTGGRQIIATQLQQSTANAYSYVGADLAAISGCKINVVKGYFVHPETGVYTLYWPAHKVALVCPQSARQSSDSLGMTWHCMGEYEEIVGPWIRSSKDAPPPALPGTAIQTGDAFLPVVKYPNWIAIVDVCEPGQLTTGLYDDALFNTGIIPSLY